MHTGRYVFSQLLDFVPMYEFNKAVRRYRGDHRVRAFSCYDQFLCMSFGQLTSRHSLREIVACLNIFETKLYHVGFRGRVSRSTLADANKSRDWRIYADFARVLIAQARALYADEKFGVDLDDTVYALDASTIDLCLSLFPWARFRKSDSAVRLHTVLNLRGNIPDFMHVSDGKMHDVNLLDMFLPEAGSIYVMDRGYLHFARLYAFQRAGAFFVVRGRKRFNRKRIRSHPIDTTTGLRCDQTVVPTGKHSKTTYPQSIRRIAYRDHESGKEFTFLTNNFELPALTIAQLYKARWQVELFFKWIKQHLRMTTFYGTSENAVKTQIWIGVSVYVLVAIIKKRLRLGHSLYTILQILGLSLFENTPILQLFSKDEHTTETTQPRNQLELFDF